MTELAGAAVPAQAAAARADELHRRYRRAILEYCVRRLRSREEIQSLIGDDRAFEALFERPIGATLDATFSDDVVAGVVLTDALIGTFAAAHDDDLRQNRCLLYHLIGNGTGDWLVPVGGMGALTAALERAARAAGATLLANAEVLAMSSARIV